MRGILGKNEDSKMIRGMYFEKAQVSVCYIELIT